MLACPNCRKRLARKSTPAGDIHECRTCGGRMAGIEVLRKERAAQGFLSEGLERARDASAPRLRRCPGCGRRMSEVGVRVGKVGAGADEPDPGDLRINVCTLCASIWFDAGEYASVPRRGEADAPSGAKPSATKPGATRPGATKPGATRPAGARPRSTWQYLPAALGMPVETDAEAHARRPWVTWGAAALAVVVFVGARVLQAVLEVDLVEVWGFIPDEWSRRVGATVLACFFLHAGPVHLLTNVYFLVAFGDDVEDGLGHGRFALLLLAAHLAGTVVHGLFDPDSTMPFIGASGAISGVIAYYALAFPRARLAVLLLFLWWIAFPAWVWFLIWTALQALGAVGQMEGLSNVSSIAHLGGAAVGVVAALASRESRNESLRLAGVGPKVK